MKRPSDRRTGRISHSRGTTAGRIVHKLTSPAAIKTHTVAASPDNSDYLVDSGKTGARAAHKTSELREA
ncbi:DUF2945 domain-containing protein [Brevundimonas sp. DC300-4]|uniref:DUF2945 domain-containing protein n=1 Tax=unclassified Brevundimonas TaxID=2622653 RepID=UPI003CF8D542